VFQKFFHTASYRRKLPVPFFEVLDQEQAALRGGQTTAFSWDFATDHLKEPTAGLLEKIKPLLSPPERPNLRETCTDEVLVQWLNKLLHTPRSLYDERNFPKAALKKETVAMAGLDLDPSELTRLNRLLLEEAFPEHLKTIEDIHLEKIYGQIHAGEGSAALCFSGGGIRSATFALGVAQGLAARGVLRHFDYLSTVSGGGYLGSWLSSWIHRTGSREKVFAALSATRAKSPTEPEPAPLNHLRKYSNYLTPRLGDFSADTWTLVSTYLRNLLLNWLVFIPILLALFALPRLHVALLHIHPPAWTVAAGFVAGFVLLGGALAYGAMNRPSVRTDFKEHGGTWFARRTQESFIGWCLAPLCLAAICLTTSWRWAQSGAMAGTDNAALKWFLRFICGTPGRERPDILSFCLLGALLHFSGWLVAEIFLQRWRSGKRSVMCWEFLLAGVTGAVGGIFLWNIATRLMPAANVTTGLALYACFAAPLFLAVFLFTATIFIGAASKVTFDEDREWWARMGAWVMIAIVGWSLFGTLVLFGPLGLLDSPRIFGTLLGLLGGISGLFTLIVGYNSDTTATRDGKRKDGLVPLLLEKGLGLAAPLSLAALVASLSFATSGLLMVAARQMSPAMLKTFGFSDAPALTDFNRVVSDSPWRLVAGFMAACAFIGWGLSRLINVNKFSLHAIYRNRLVRAYLGASNPRRDPNPFTGFDPADNLPLQDLRDPGDSTLPQRPLHIINMALNLVTGENLAWQQRKAETFTASTLHCGNFRLGYRFTKHYAVGPHKTGLSVGTAIAISGAAASPNQGYHSSPMVALLMTLFNVRLGWWLGNPGAMGHKTFHDPAPSSPVLHMVKEGLGLTDSTSPYVYLSDGGHFENLGLYEMILRRCRLVVVSDAGCDPDCSLEDLGNAIRKIRVDLGVKIEIKKFEIYSRTDEEGKKSGRYCAIGEIDYGTADEGGQTGTLIYIKPALLGTEPRDIYNYSRVSDTFPHESTSDQWFSESQFESYRALGQQTIDWIFSRQSEAIPEDAGRARVLNDFVAQACNAAGAPFPRAGNLFAEEKPSADMAQTTGSRRLETALPIPQKI
jgi:Patatin-like phospholipase